MGPLASCPPAIVPRPPSLPIDRTSAADRGPSRDGTLARDALGELLGALGTSLLKSTESKTLRSLPPEELTRELCAFSYALLGLLLAAQNAGAPLGTLVRRELIPLLTQADATNRDDAPLLKGVECALRSARAGDPEAGVAAQGGLYDGSLMQHLLGEDGKLPRQSGPTLRALLLFFQELTVDPLRPPRALLGGLYEGLLELEARLEGNQLTLRPSAGEHSRRKLGSYYTPLPLISEVLDRALEPLIEEKLKEPHPDLLSLKILDPSCGSGDFLAAAAERIAARLPSSGPEDMPERLARVLNSCIFGIDLDPLAREICRLGLWLEIARAKNAPPLGALRIQVGNSVLLPPPSGHDKSLAYFDWHAEFPDVMARGGFDAIIGNPPWIAHAGRAAQRLAPPLRAHYERWSEAFAGYPTTHGVFAGTLPPMLRPGGRLGLVLPTSVSELAGYLPTRRAHDRYNAFEGELLDFGEGKFPGVTQPCMALVSVRTLGGRGEDAGAPWPVARPELGPVERALLEKACALEPLPKALFGERGLQSDRALREHFLKANAPEGRFTVPLREGSDIREFWLGPPRLFADPSVLEGRLRPRVEFQEVRILIRQTARFPIATLSDGLPFRNSLLAGFELPEWPASALVALLNSSFVRWIHYQRYREARQPILPQVKISHLRSIPAPPQGLGTRASELTRFTEDMSGQGELSSSAWQALDALVFDLYGLRREERAVIERFRDGLKSSKKTPQLVSHSRAVDPR